MSMYGDDRVVTLLREMDLPPAPPDRLGQVTRRARRGESRRASALAGVMAVVLFAGVVSAVSLHNRSSSEVLTVAEAVNATQATGSARMTMRVTITNSPQPNVFKGGKVFDVTGLADFVHQRYVLTGTSAGQSIETRIIGKDRWTKIPTPVGFGDVGGKPWLHTVEKSSESAAGVFNDPDPRVLLEALTEQGTVVNTKQVGDRRQTVLRLPGGFFGSSSSAAGDADSQVTIDIDGAGRIRRMATQMTAAELGTLTMTLRYDDFGIEVDVQPPPADEVQEAPTSGSSSSSQGFSLSPSSSPAERAKACERIKAMVQQMPVPNTEQEKAQRAMFDQAVAATCAKS
ncbi:MAG: hypothetical protein JJD92_13760 [Frankiaceae bacterium]|nr:hypothetical protein [Frankiaceae bacterium]